mgnify:CR=1 FL=1
MSAPDARAGQALWRGTFNQWHMGLAGHINIQHTAEAIDDARQAFVLQSGIDPVAARRAGTGFGARRMWVDFRHELAPGDAGHITAAPDLASDGQAILRGALMRSPDDMVAIRFETTIDRIDLASGDFGEALPLETATSAAPPETPALRPIPRPPGPPKLTPAMQQSWLGTVEGRDADGSDRMTTRALFDVATRGIWAVQNVTGMTRDRLSDEGIGAGVTALQVEQIYVPAAGDLLSAHTGVLGMGERSCRFRHLVRDVASGRDVAVVDYVIAFFDRRSGAGARLTPEYRAIAERLLIDETA